MILVPDSWGSPLREFNTCHDPASGRFCSGTGGAKVDRKTGAPARREKVTYTPSVNAKGAIQVRTVEEAVEHILAGRDVELASKRQVNTVLTKLAAIAHEAKQLGQHAPHYDLCKVSVAGTNVFCVSRLRTKQYPGGVPRIEMPQMGGHPVPGSAADRLPKNDAGEVDGSQAFIAHLKSKGIKVTAGRTPAARLRASQAELVGSNVAGMMTSTHYDPAAAPIFVSRDDYVIDGHHRWAATVGRDAADGRLGGLKMKTLRVDAPISRILRLANAWAKNFGIAPKSLGKK
jgi:hypothetical protein